MKETKFQRDCIEYVRKHYTGRLLCVNNHGGGFTNKGFPDLTIYGAGKAVVVELKSDSGYGVREDQKVWQRRFLKVGVHHYVIENNDIEHFKRMLREEFPNETEC